MPYFGILKKMSLENRLDLLTKLKSLFDNMTEFTEDEMEYLIFLVEEDIDDRP